MAIKKVLKNLFGDGSKISADEIYPHPMKNLGVVTDADLVSETSISVLTGNSLNNPLGTWAILLVFNQSNSRWFQLAIHQNGASAYIRTYWDSVSKYRGWHQIL